MSDKAHHDTMRLLLADSTARANTTILLGPDVLLDFSDSPTLVPVFFAPCVTVMSVASFPAGGVDPLAVRTSRAHIAYSGQLAPGDVLDLPELEPDYGVDPVTLPSARTPHSPGPLLRFGKHSRKTAVWFLAIRCNEDGVPADNVRLSGFRVEGPSLGQQTVDQFGIHVFRCVDVEISNMEVFGWGGAAIRVEDGGGDGPGQESPSNRPGDRIGRPTQVKIFSNYLHHNQHESTEENDGDWNPLTQHAAGYGVDVHTGVGGNPGKFV